MQYLVRFTHRALRDMGIIYDFAGGDSSDLPFARFNELGEAVRSFQTRNLVARLSFHIAGTPQKKAFTGE